MSEYRRVNEVVIEALRPPGPLYKLVQEIVEAYGAKD